MTTQRSNLVIYGAGLAGLLAANMLRRHLPVVREAQASLPANHSALLRFRTDAVSRASGIPFRRVLVQKGVFIDGLTRPEAGLSACNAYALKVAGRLSARSIGDLRPCVRYIAPADFTELLARNVNVEYGVMLHSQEFHEATYGRHPIISTIPLPDMLRMTGYAPTVDFESRPIWTQTFRLNIESDVFQTVYFPTAEVGALYRASLHGNELICEFAEDPESAQYELNFYALLSAFGLSRYAVEPLLIEKGFRKHGKLVSGCDDPARLRAIMWLTDEHNVYSLGRFATWRNLLLDDLVNDVELIDGWLNCRSGYERRKGLAVCSSAQ